VSGAAVHVLTTEGPARIQRIVEEDPSVRSVICLDGLTQILPISPAYDAFVRRPTGVIERISGHGAYRMDVSARIDEGQSWQLAAYIAHVAHLQGSTGMTVFATGEVDSHLAVRPVEHVDLKLAALARFLDARDIDTDKAVIVVPDASGDVPEQLGGIAVRKVVDVAGALSLAGLEVPATIEAATPGTGSAAPAERPGIPLFAVLSGAVLLAALLFWAGGDFVRWSAVIGQGRVLDVESSLADAGEETLGQVRAGAFRAWLGLSKPAAPVDIVGSIFVADGAAACDDAARREERPMAPVYEGPGAICMVQVRAVGGAGDVVVGRLGYWPSGLGSGIRPTRIMRGSGEVNGRTWTLEFTDFPQSGAALRLVAVTGAVEIRGPQPWYQDLLAAPVNSPVFEAARARLMQLGFAVTVLDWRRE